MSAEEWRPIPEFAGAFDASSLGRVRSNLRPERNVRTPRLNADGYYALTLVHNQHRVTRPVHRLVGEAFLGPLPKGLMTRHLNGDKLDNRPENLAYGTATENQLDEVRLGRHVHALKTQCPAGHIYDESNTYRWGGKRACRACRRIKEAGRRAARRALAASA